jgi:hypothetical protein
MVTTFRHFRICELPPLFCPFLSRTVFCQAVAISTAELAMTFYCDEEASSRNITKFCFGDACRMLTTITKPAPALLFSLPLLRHLMPLPPLLLQLPGRGSD